MSDYEICEVCGKDHGYPGGSCPKPEPKPVKTPWYLRAAGAVVTVAARCLFASDRDQ